ncbi:MAG: D-sedoheptulose 7-phosphate isomerase [Pseudonocardiales bacterium]|jgi:D-sedoheptulose 7-phosphate isomerase|nr:D-sedoheptulose 7-phosphate isomerase [Pseudonocardiales bacterium]MDT4976184.1 D-sedoheptulose 7-phosphate isomerase [Pseudonocardiales bacterium]
MTSADTERTGFLYPFIDADEHDPESLLADLAKSAQAKVHESSALQRSTLDECAELVASAGAQMAERFASGGRMYAFGNGGSSTDAATFAALFAQPITGRPLPAMNLAADQAVVTALGNDVGFELVFSRQIIAHASSRDIAVAMSTSGSSADLMMALGEAARRGLMTIGFAGYEGGQMATSSEVGYCFVVRSQSIHRIQESQALLGYQLWATVQQHLMPAESAPHRRGDTT